MILINMLSQKGYSVSDIREIEKDWSPQVSEMSINKIIDQLTGVVDALFVMHYMDVGPFLWDSINRKNSATGFSQLRYTISMFDTKTKKKILFLEYEEISPIEAISNDPIIKNNPELKKKA